MLLLFPVIEE